MEGFINFCAVTSKFCFTSFFHDNDMHEYASSVYSPLMKNGDTITVDDDIMLCGIVGPSSVKYAVFMGFKTYGIAGVLAALLISLLPPLIITFAIYLFYTKVYLKSGMLISMFRYSFNGALAVSLGLFVSHIMKVLYNNKLSRKSYLIIILAAFIYMIAVSSLDNNNSVIAPYFIASIVGFSFLMAIIRYYWEKHRAKMMELHPERYKLDPYSRKAVKMRDRALMEEEERMRR